LGVWPYNIRYLKPVAAGGLSAAVILLAMLVFTPPEGVPAILVFSPLFLLSYVAANLTFGLDVNDKRFLQSTWVAARRRIGRVV
jgi:hypothetical protein